MQTITPIIQRVIVPIPKMLERIVQTMRTAPRTEFEVLFADADSRAEVVATFIALLSLVKEGHVTLTREIQTDVKMQSCREQLFCTLQNEDGAIQLGEVLAEFDG